MPRCLVPFIFQFISMCPVVFAATGSAESPVGPLETVRPAFSGLSASPPEAFLNEIVLISFAVSEALAAPPGVLVDGLPATFVGQSGMNYTFSFMVAYENQPGLAIIEITGQDLVGNAGSLSDTATLEIGGLPMSLHTWWLAMVILGIALALSARTAPHESA